MTDRAVLSTWEAGRYCNVSPFTVRAWVEKGMLAAYATPGGHRRIRREDLDEFLDHHQMPAARDFEPGGRRVLLVEGDPRSRRNLAQVLRNAAPGVSVRAPADPFAAGTLVYSFAPQLVVFDLDDRRFDWRAAAAALRRTPGLGRTRAAGVSAIATVALVEEAQRAGLIEVLAKPLTSESARDLLRGIFPYLRLSPAARSRRSRTEP